MFDLGDPEQGISHVVAPEVGMVLPGATHAVPDSHASTVGGLGAMAFGCGTTELAHILATQVIAMKRPKSMRIRLDGTLAPHVTAKDVALRIIARARHGRRPRARRRICRLGRARDGDGRPHDALQSQHRDGRPLGLRARRTNGTFNWIAGRPFAPQGAQWDQALAHWRTLRSDDDATFDTDHVIDCAGLEPQITWGTDPSQVVGISGRVPDPASDPNRRAIAEGALAYMGLTPGTPLAGLPINRVFIGSCTNARLPDLEAAADVVRGRHVAEGVVGAGGAGLVVGEARGRGEGPRQGVPRRRLRLGRIRLLDVRRRQRRPRRAGRAHRLHHQPQFREPAGPEDAHASRQPRDRGRQRDRRPHRRRAQPGGRLMQPFSKHTGVAVPLLKDDINTDQVAPVQAMRALKPDYKALLFMRAKQRDDGSEDPDFVLNKPQFRNPGILVTGNNFGAGSSREAAVWGMLANNIRVIVARSFADIYRENCLQNGLLPVTLAPGDAEAFEKRVIEANGAAPFTVDLETQTISGPGGPDIKFDIPASDRTRLLEGLDDIGMTLKHTDDIKAFEKRMAASQPWLQTATDSRLNK